MGLIGIDWGHLTLGDEAGRQNPTGIMGVVPVWKLQEVLDLPEVIDLREQLGKKLDEEMETGAVLDSADESEYERFENLSRRLLSASKQELDEERGRQD